MTNNPENKEKVQAFKGEIAESLDLQIEHWKNIAYYYENQLRSVRGKILKELTADDKIDDLNLNEKDLEEVFNLMKADLAQFEVKDLPTFKFFIGIDGLSMDSFDKTVNGLLTSTTTKAYSSEGKLLRKSYTVGSAEVGYQRKHIFYDEKGKPSHEENVDNKSGARESLMYDSKGDTLGIFTHEKEKNPGTNIEDYLNKLALKLNTLEKLHVFFMNIGMRYMYDDPSKRNEGRRFPNIFENNDYWQTAAETVMRAENNKMLGDCDDYAFLACDILTRQGKHATVIDVGEHAVCIWMDRNKNGNFNIYSLCTFGLDVNGNLYGNKVDKYKQDGYKTIGEAYIAITEKYKKKPGTKGIPGIKVFKNEDPRALNIFGEVSVLRIPEKGKQQVVNLPITYLYDSGDKGEACIMKIANNYSLDVTTRANALLDLYYKYSESRNYLDEIAEVLRTDEARATFFENTIFKYGFLLTEHIYAALEAAYTEGHGCGKGLDFPEKNIDKMIKLCEFAIRKNPSLSPPYLQLVNIYCFKKDTANALRIMDLIERNSPANFGDLTGYLLARRKYVNNGFH